MPRSSRGGEDGGVSEDIRVRPGTDGDAETLLAMRRRAEAWLDEQGIVQWPVGSGDSEWFAEVLANGRWFVSLDTHDRIVAAATCETRDELVWPDDPPGEARYIHGFMTDRSVARPGDGAALLRWLERLSAREGARFVRLDCVETNPRLRQFYRDQGYAEVGRREFPGHWYSAALFEKALSPPD